MWERAKATASRIARGARINLVPFLLVLALLGIFAGVYYAHWRTQPVVPTAYRDIPEAPTMGGVRGVYKAPGIPDVNLKERARTATRTVRTVPVSALPEKERAMAPPVLAVDLPADRYRLGLDNAGAGIPEPEMAAASTVPAHRAPTEVRTYLMPSGEFRTTLVPQREPFLGLEGRRLELEAGIGLGAQSVVATARWMPLRLGDVHVGVEGTGWMESGGAVRGAALLKVRWEPWR